MLRRVAKLAKNGHGHNKSGYFTLHVSNDNDEKVITGKETVARVKIVK